MAQPSSGYQQPHELPWDPRNAVFPTRSELPELPGAPHDAAWVWGADDNLGRLNLLTEARIVAAAAGITSGQSARVDLPLNVPVQPSWDRQVFQHAILQSVEDGRVVGHDDTYCLNTQSSTQWDGFRHMAHGPTGLFYNNTAASDITGPAATDRSGINHWCHKALAGRGVLLDYRAYAESQGLPPYDTTAAHAITWAELAACGRFQGVDIRPERQGGDIKVGDFLFIRSGFVQDYQSRSDAANRAVGQRAVPQYAGVSQEPAMVDWLHDCYFAAVAGDAPAFECWPTQQPYKLHEYLLALWGVPIGEMLDLEAVSALARSHQRWTFFFCSAPANCPGGVGSHVNGTAIF